MKCAIVWGATLGTLLWTASAGAQLRAAGYAHGKDHCYHFQAPSGWAMDTQAMAEEGVSAAFHPAVDTHWRRTWNFIYTRPVPTLPEDKDPIRTQADGMLRIYRDGGEVIAASQVDTVETPQGETGQVWEFTGYRHGGRELVAYFQGRRTVNFFVAPVPRQADPAAVRAALLEIAESYREDEDCLPCATAGTCRVPASGD